MLLSRGSTTTSGWRPRPAAERCTRIDSNVQAFAPAGNGNVYVERDRPLPLAGGPRLAAARRPGSTATSRPSPRRGNGNVYVEGTDHDLWLEAPGWQQHGGTFVDNQVQAFAAGPHDRYLYVEGTDHYYPGNKEGHIPTRSASEGPRKSSESRRGSPWDD